MKILSYQWPLVLWATHDRVVTENHSLKRHLLETQRELAKHRLLLGRLGDADQATEQAFARARDAAKGAKA